MLSFMLRVLSPYNPVNHAEHTEGYRDESWSDGKDHHRDREYRILLPLTAKVTGRCSTQITNRFEHPKYLKQIERTTKMQVHDELQGQLRL